LAVFDAVYNPRRTFLLRQAAAAGCRTVEGMEMFLGQAMVQFELWTGVPAPGQAMRRVIEERL
jgi:shikimate dehydrogenase